MENKAKITFFLILLIELASITAAAPVKAIEIVGSISVRATGAWAYNPNRREMWMAYSVPYVNELGMNVGKIDSVVVVSVTDHSVVANITVGEYPTAIAYDQQKNLMFVANTNSHTISVISASTFKILKTIVLPDYQTISSLSDIKYNPRMGEILVLDYFDGTLTVISDDTLNITKTIALGNDPYPARLSLSDQNESIFISHAQKSGSSKQANFISILDDQTFELTAIIQLSSNGSLTDLDSGKGVLYAVNGGAISFISQSNFSSIITVPFNLSPSSSLVYDSAKDALFVTNPTSNLISVISASAHTLIENITLTVSPLKIEYISNRGELYFTNSGGTPLILSDASIPNPTGTISTTSPLPSPSIPEFSLGMILPLLIFMLLIAVILSYRKFSKKRLCSHQKQNQFLNRSFPSSSNILQKASL